MKSCDSSSPSRHRAQPASEHANLEGVTRLELTIIPAINRADAVATLKEWSFTA